MAETPRRPADLSESKADPPPKPTRLRSASSAETDRAASADSVPVAIGTSALLPKNFGRYQVLRELGRGQMGAVYLALDTELDRPVALKVARVSSSGSAKLLKRMEIEAKSAAKVDHPLICKVYDAGEIEGIRFIALQYVEGEDLKKYLARVGRCREPEEAVRIILQILRALSAAHEKHVIHRDLKPENIMLNKNHEPVIMDFGLARHAIGSSNAGLTQGMVVGTAAYMSPEQATGRAEEIDPRSDLYAVGVILFEMLTGEWPFNGGSVEVMGKKCVLDPPSPLSLNANLPPQLADVCHRMIAKQKAERFASCAEAISAIEQIDLTDSAEPEILFDEVPESTLDFLNSPTVQPAKAKTSPMPTRSGPPEIRRKPSKGSSKDRKKRANSGTSQTKERSIPWGLIGGSGVCVLGLMAALIYSLNHKSKPEKIAPEILAEISQPATPQDATASSSKPVSIGDQPNTAQSSLADISPKTNPTEDVLATANEPAVSESDRVTGSTEATKLTFTIDSPSESEMPPNPDANREAVPKEEIASNPSDSVEDSSTDVNDLVAKALALVRGNQRKEAIPPLKRASNLAPTEPRPDFYLGFLYLGFEPQEPKDAKTKIESAEMHFNRAFNRTADRTPEHVASANNLAVVELKLRKFGAARNYFSIASKQASRPQDINHNLGRLFSQARTFDIKADELKKITTLNPTSSDFRPKTGWIFLPLDGTEQTRNDCLALNPRGALEDKSCSLCNGCAKLLCKRCVGKGKIPTLGTVNEKRDIGFGMTASSNSLTTNMVVCNVCSGSGRVDCTGCKDGRDPNLSR